uniref:Dehydrogenase/reductase (SDR family) member 4 n=1 Tax=Fundulus heteroclitus TaxID=8078 RepID=A0A3Q2PVQ2_FUNHE
IPFPPRIGLAAAQALGRRGAHVVVSSRRQANVDKAVALLQSQSIRVTGTTCNVGKGEDREKLVQLTVDQCGGIDILVSNAAVNPFFGNIMDSTEDVWDKLWENEDIVDEFKKQLSIKRIGEPEEIGGTIAFLCSDEASYITGETITVTGGMGCRL